jgi:hypothetical protein
MGDLKYTLDGNKLKASWVLVRTSGRYARSQARGGGGNEARSWLLIKHRDDWSGELDITGFAPKSVKSEGDFEDILAADTPAVWISNKPSRPAVGGDAGAMLAEIIERAAHLRKERHEDTKTRKTTSSGRTRSSKLRTQN